MTTQFCDVRKRRVDISGFQVLLIVSAFGFSWLGMQAVHELGHVIGAALTGGTVTRVTLHPFVVSETHVKLCPDPLVMKWCGPIIGVILPLLAMLAAKLLRCPGYYLFRFFAGFCLLVNGVYIGMGSFENVADAGDLMDYGAPQWTLILFGLAASSLGLYVWNGLGPHFGLAGAKGKVSKSAALLSAAIFLVIFAVEMVLGNR
jgi:hypothetical protein